MSKKSSRRRGCFLPLLLILIVCVLAGWLLWNALRPVPRSSSDSSATNTGDLTSWRDRFSRATDKVTEIPSIFFPKLEPLSSPPPTPVPVAPPQQQAAPTPRVPAQSPEPARRAATQPSTPPARRVTTPPATTTSAPPPSAPVYTPPPSDMTPAPTPAPAFPSSSLGGQFFVVRDKMSRPTGYYLVCTRDGDVSGNRYGFRVSAAEFNRSTAGMLYDARNMSDWEPVSRIE